MHVRVNAEDGVPYLAKGGLEKHRLEWMHKLLVQELADLSKIQALETGAGISTVFFLLIGFAKVTAIAPSISLERKIIGNCKKYQVPLDKLDYRLARSELELPALVKHNPPDKMYSFAFIDGDHGWPSVFVDFCYINMLLKKGGILVLDDCQYHSVRELLNLLAEDPEWELLEISGQLAALKKLSHEKHYWGAGRNYLRKRTSELPTLESAFKGYCTPF